MRIQETMAKLESIEGSLLSLVQEIRTLKEGLGKQANDPFTLEPLLDADEVAKFLGVDIAYIYTQARSGKIPSIKLGKYRKFSPSKIKKWLDRKNEALL